MIRQNIKTNEKKNYNLRKLLNALVDKCLTETEFYLVTFFVNRLITS